MRHGIGAAALLVPLFVARSAVANCARPVSYQATVTDAGVLVAPENFEGRACPDKEGLVRQDVKTGDVVSIESCEPDGGARFVDSCVAPGKYRYGFARPYECAPAACWTDYYVEVDVTNPPGCVAPPHAKVVAAPWGTDPRICSSSGRLARVGLGVVVVAIALIAAIVVGIVGMKRRKQRPDQAP